MKPGLLLDTHIALWWFTASPRLKKADRELIQTSRCWISAASIWEIAIKYKLGKLPVAPETVLQAADQSSIILLSITPAQAAATQDLPLLHHDPFDRLLIAQSRMEKLTLLTSDVALGDYGAGIKVAS